MKYMQSNNKGLIFLTSIIVLVVFSRLMPHAPNFTPVGAVTLLGAGFYSKRLLAFVVPLLSMWLSDLILNNVVYGVYFDKFTLFTSFQIYTFAAIALTALLGINLFSKITAGRVFAGTVASAVIFFLITNFGSWLGNVAMYPQNLGGLVASYVAGLPFLLNMLLSNLIFGFIFFYGYMLITNQFTSLKLSSKPA